MSFFEPNNNRRRRMSSAHSATVSTIYASVYRKRLSDSQMIHASRRLHKDMEASRIKQEKSMAESYEFAKHYYSK